MTVVLWEQGNKEVHGKTKEQQQQQQQQQNNYVSKYKRCMQYNTRPNWVIHIYSTLM